MQLHCALHIDVSAILWFDTSKYDVVTPEGNYSHMK